MRKVEIQHTQVVFDHVFKIQEAAVRFQKFNGQMSETVQRLVFERGDSAAALLLNRETQKVILINQFRYPTYIKGQGWLYEIVAGSVEEGEQPEACIRREVREEIGYEIKELTHIATFYVSPGGTSERIILFYGEVSSADQVSSGGGLASEHEDIEQVELTLPEFWQALADGTIMDAKTLIAAQWLQMRQETLPFQAHRT